MRALGGVGDVHHGVLHWPGVLKDVDRSSQALDNGPFHAATFRREVAEQALVILDIRIRRDTRMRGLIERQRALQADGGCVRGHSQFMRCEWFGSGGE